VKKGEKPYLEFDGEWEKGVKVGQPHTSLLQSTTHQIPHNTSNQCNHSQIEMIWFEILFLTEESEVREFERNESASVSCHVFDLSNKATVKSGF